MRLFRQAPGFRRAPQPLIPQALLWSGGVFWARNARGLRHRARSKDPRGRWRPTIRPCNWRPSLAATAAPRS